MPGKDPDLEKLIPADLLQHPASNSPRPPGHDAILDLLAAQPPADLLEPSPSAASDALNHPFDVFTSAEPPAIFRPGDIGIMSPNPTFPGIAPPDIPGPSQNPARSKPTVAGTGNPPPLWPPSAPGADEPPASPLSSLPTLDPARFSTEPFVPPLDPSAAAPAASTGAPSPPGQTIPNIVRDILPLLPDAAGGPSADDDASWREAPDAMADPSHSAPAAPSGSTSKIEQAAARDWPAVTVKLGEGHFMAKRLLLAMSHKCEEAARELCKTEIHRTFSSFRAEMRANFH
jgi:hypothetical protein